MSNKFVKESELAKTLGVDRLILVAIRNKTLVHRKDWKKDKRRGRKILLTESGVKKILDELKVEVLSLGGDVSATNNGSVVGSTVAPADVQTVSGAQNGEYILQVHRLYQNPYVLEAKSEDGTIFRVQVRSNLKYTIGDKLKAISEPGVAGMLRQIGGSPRWKGDKAYLHRM